MRRVLGYILVSAGAAVVTIGAIFALFSNTLRDGLLTLATIAPPGFAIGAFGLALIRRRPLAITDIENWAEALRSAARAESSNELRQLRHTHTGRPLAVGVGPAYGLDGGMDERAFALNGPHSVANYLLAGPAQRLLVSGDAGAGKTVFLRQIQETLLNDQINPSRLPVFLRLADWDGIVTRQTFDNCIARLIKRQLTDAPIPVIERLLQSGRMVLLLDGLDEASDGMSPDRTLEVMSVLNAVNDRVMVVTLRTGTLMLGQTHHVTVQNAPTIRLLPVTLDVVEFTVRRACIDMNIEEKLAIALADFGDGCLASCLKQPLFLRVIADLQIDHSIGNSLDAFSSLPDTEANRNRLEDGLLSIFVTQAAFGRSKQEAEHKLRHRKSKPTFFSPALVTSAGSALARYLDCFGGKRIGGEIMSHNLLIPHYLWPLPGRRLAEFTGGALSIALWTPLFTLILVTANHSGWPKSYKVLTLLLLVVFLCSLIMALGPVRPLRISIENVASFDGLIRQGGLRRLSLGLAASAWIGVVAALQRGAEVALLFGSGFMLAFGLGFATAVRPDVEESVTTVCGVAVGALMTQVTIQVFGVTSQGMGFVCGAASGGIGLVAAVGAGTIAWKRLGRPSLAFRRVRYSDPFFRLKADIQTASTVGVVSALLVFAATREAPFRQASTVMALAIAISAGIAAGPGLISVAWRRYAAMLILSCRTVPIRFGRFLRWSYASGILRRSSGSYEFRHSRFERYFLDAARASGDDLTNYFGP